MKSHLSILVIISIGIFFFSIMEGGTYYLISSHILEKELRTGQYKEYNTKVKRIKEVITNRMLLLDESMREQVKEYILVNSLVDMNTRRQFLTNAVNEIKIPRFEHVDISYHKYNFKLLRANTKDWEKRNGDLFQGKLSPQNMVLHIKEKKVLKHFVGTKEIFAMPIIYNGRGQGMLVAIADWQPLWQELFAELEIALCLLYEGKPIAFTGDIEAMGQLIESEIDIFPGLELKAKVLESKVQETVFSVQKQIIMANLLAFLVLLCIGILFTKWLTGPLIQLQKAVSKIRQGEDVDSLPLQQGSKEVVHLAQTFKEMMRRLNQTYHELEEEKEKRVQQAYLSGIAENAIGILHNIGNGITPMVVSVAEFRQLTNLRRLSTYFGKLQQTLSTHQDSKDLGIYLAEDPKGTQMLDFFIKLNAQLGDSIQELDDTAAGIDEQLKHIAGIIRLQQKYANFKAEAETVYIGTVMADVLKMTRDMLNKRGIAVIQHIPRNLPPMRTDKNKLVQVMQNLVKNTIESIDEQWKLTPSMHKKIEIGVVYEENMIKVSIQDNGIGVTKETAMNAFNFGFSTKENGSGFGLHDCANFIKAQNGEISLEPGEQQGAVLRFSLPVQAQVESISHG
ncbi:MAG: hypothetical protein COB67_05505 [SAR324 cluster bacterium]|uniref:histidine kinase n=1 Tax=SAR324 cluster bacterium TaxID=2024889 RepID=A0A2A4T5B0_9DELT|nr:MAG: hypothetical protein COB67_05505 [SAR324 cluster bacterium]